MNADYSVQQIFCILNKIESLHNPLLINRNQNLDRFRKQVDIIVLALDFLYDVIKERENLRFSIFQNPAIAASLWTYILPEFFGFVIYHFGILIKTDLYKFVGLSLIMLQKCQHALNMIGAENIFTLCSFQHLNEIDELLKELCGLLGIGKMLIYCRHC